MDSSNETEQMLEAAGLSLERTDDRLTLTDGALSLCVDFATMQNRVKQQNLERELLIKAVHVKGLARTQTVFDATAGLGEDSFLLAAAGFQVLACEKNPVIAALLLDGVRRASEGVLSEVASRMCVETGDSLALMADFAQAATKFDVVYLDPMFPGRTKSAEVHKKFQLLHKLERPCVDEKTLFDFALQCAAKKVVVKRPAKGPWLGNAKPGYALQGKAVRFDVYPVQS